MVSSEDVNIGISVQKGNTELKDAINGVLATMTEDDYNAMDGRGHFHPAAERRPAEGFFAQHRLSAGRTTAPAT